MKNLKILAFIILIAFISACQEDFLNTEILTSKTDGNFYATPEEANQALIGCYDGLQRMWHGGTAMNLASDVMSDLCFGGTGAPDPDGWPMLDEFDITREPASQNMFETNWEQYYVGIFRCNRLILALNDNEWGENEAELLK